MSEINRNLFRVGMRFRLSERRCKVHGSKASQEKYGVNTKDIFVITRLSDDGRYGYMNYPNKAHGELAIYKRLDHCIPLPDKPIIFIK